MCISIQALFIAAYNWTAFTKWSIASHWSLSRSNSLVKFCTCNSIPYQPCTRCVILMEKAVTTRKMESPFRYETGLWLSGLSIHYTNRFSISLLLCVLFWTLTRPCAEELERNLWFTWYDTRHSWKRHEKPIELTISETLSLFSGLINLSYVKWYKI